MMKQISTDVLVVGSGFGAAPVGLRLAEAGLNVTIIEKGPAIDPYRDFRHTQDPQYLLRYLKTLCGEDLRFNYIEGEGGGSGFYEMMSFRAPSETFDLTDADGRLLWPVSVSRSSLDPYYDIGRRMLNVHQIPEKQVPKNGQVFALLMKRLGYSVERINYAVDHCMDCGRCVTGCIYGAKQSLLVTYLPRAKDAGARFVPDMEAQWVERLIPEHDESRLPYRYVAHCRGKGGHPVGIRCRILILAAGTVGTAKILLRSRPYLSRLNPHIGRHISFTGSVRMAALTPEWCPDGDLFAGRSNPGVMSFEFLRSHGLAITTAKPLPLQLFGTARISRKAGGEFGYWGKDHVALMKQLRHRVMFLAAFGNLASRANISLDRKRKPVLSLQNTGAAKAFYAKGQSRLQEIVEQSGGEMLDVKFMHDGLPYKHLHLTTAHQVGSCRMAERPEDGVVDPDGEVFGYPGMYISDGSVLPSSVSMGPSFTILANAERIAHGILKRYDLHTGRVYSNTPVMVEVPEYN
jgi:choline dehydrogenase-like flavoprotein